jgi:ankyrin repeat protein
MTTATTTTPNQQHITVVNNIAILIHNQTITTEQIHNATVQELEMDTFNGMSVLYCACCTSPIRIVEAILDKGVDIDAFSTGKVTALMGVVSNNNPDKLKILQTLLRRKANVKLICTKGRNALHYATYFYGTYPTSSILDYTNNQVIKLLIDAGTDPYVRDINNKTPSAIAQNTRGSMKIDKYYRKINPRPTTAATFLA